jgi:hypothetical protein
MPPPDEPESDIQSIPAFQSGQLMKAYDLNRLVDALKQLDRRLASLELYYRTERPKA